MTVNQRQPLLWQDADSNLIFADLCNALYERELRNLSADTNLPHAFLLKRLSALPYYIKRASTRILAFYSPLDLDSQNASWIYKQPTQCPASKQTHAQVTKFYTACATIALIVPVYQATLGEELITLDTIDGVDAKTSRIHTNENGWFSLAGESVDDDNQNKRLLKPNKLIMTCACSGHKWLNKKRSGARALPLRQMLLATNINWKNFAMLTKAQ